MEQIQKPQTLQPTKVNLERSESSISDQYDNLVDGLQKEGTQNSWDARIDKVTANGWSVKFSLNTEESTLKVEDNGTTGMNESKWEKFHGLWYSDKSDSEDLGYRGQGKLLLHACGEFVIAETVDDKGVYRCRYSSRKVTMILRGRRNESFTTKVH